MIVTKSVPISYCSGVTKAIQKAIEVRKKYNNKKIYFLGDLVHNQHVIDAFKAQDISIIKFTNSNVFSLLSKINSDDIVILSAHGHSKEIEKYLTDRKIVYFDTTCEKVYKILNKIENSSDEIIYIGKKGHPECEASLTYSNKVYLYDIDSEFDFSVLKTDHPLVINQSTLSFVELNLIFENIKKHLPNAKFTDEICDATRVRQEKILNLDKSYDLIIVVGDSKSSNSNKLFELAKNKNINALMVNSLDELIQYDLSLFNKVYLTSGTSTPIEIINEIETYLKEI